MVNILTLDIPQLMVYPQTSYTSISKKWFAEMDRFFLSNYMSEKMQGLSVKHYWLNELIRGIFIDHQKRKMARADTEFYPRDEHHHLQLLKTNVVCENIAALTQELAYCLYFLKFIKDFNRCPDKKEPSESITGLLVSKELNNGFSDYESYLKLTGIIRNSYHINSIISTSSIMLTDENPVFFVVDKNEQIVKHSFQKFLEDYNAVFLLCMKNLHIHSPEAIAYSMERWIK